VLVRIDHLVLTTANVDACVDFYVNGLGMRLERFGEGRMALAFGQQKINIHEQGREFEPKALKPTPGGLDMCFVTAMTPDEVMQRLDAAGIRIEEGPVTRTGALGPIMSVYVRDPDGNLVEISSY